MEQKKTLTKTNDNLLEIRQETLKNVSNETIRPHGKLWGMDVFTWNNPDVSMLASTIQAFPFPVVLLTPASLLMSVVDFDSTVKLNINATIVSIDDNCTLNMQLLNAIPTVALTESMEESLGELQQCKIPRGIVLFCQEGQDAQINTKKFLEFLTLHQ